MRKPLLVAFIALGLPQASCDAEAPPGDEGYVLLDADAREAGFALEIEGEVTASALPVAISDEVRVVLVGPEGRRTLSVSPGELVHVVGEDGEVESLEIGEEVDPGRLQLESTREAATALADALGAEVVETEDGMFELRGEDLLDAAGEAETPEGLIAISPVAPEDRAALATEADSMVAAGRLRTANAVAAPALVAAPVVVDPARYGMRAMVDEALDRFEVAPAVSCEDPVAGTWISYDHFDGEWYTFTFTLDASPKTKGKYSGRVAIEMWDSWDQGDYRRPACDGRRHALGSMPATGTLDEAGQLSVQGTAFTLDQTVCGPELDDYNLDHFTGIVSDSRFASVNNDGGRMVNHPTPFRRISCK